MFALVIVIGLAPLVALLAIALALSPGKPAEVRGDDGKVIPGSLSAKVFVEINGASQGMFIVSSDPRNPVMLVVHGGLPEYFLAERHPTGLERLFTVVWWEQRGSGMSYRGDTSPASITPELLIADTVAVTNYLRERFHQPRIYLMAHSGGTFIGIQAAARHPELFHAYIGVAQYADQIRSEMLAYAYMLEESRKRGDAQTVRALESAPVTLADGTPPRYLAVRDRAMHALGIGTMREMRSIVTGLFLPSLTFRGYSLREKLEFWKGKARSGVSVLWGASLHVDMSEQVPALDIPVYFLEGIYDYTCNYGLAEAYFRKLKAPVKGFYTFRRSAHSPHFEEPERTRLIMEQDVLRATSALSDVR
jgi:pimeloyl-ACP methyl ester carboxylesterase